MHLDNLFNNQPFWSILPLQFGDYPEPYKVGDYPSLNKGEDWSKGWADWVEKLQKQPIVGKRTLNPSNWTSNTEGGQTFRLEVVGYGKEHVSAEIKDNLLYVSGKRGQKSFNQNYSIPENLDTANPVATVEHGLLEIKFSAKKQEVKGIKIL